MITQDATTRADFVQFVCNLPGSELAEHKYQGNAQETQGGRWISFIKEDICSPLSWIILHFEYV